MKLLIITNLYPLPWEPNRATFNKQQFDRLAESNDITVIVPIAWSEYLRHRDQLKSKHVDVSYSVKYACFWYTPKILRQYYGCFMVWSLLPLARKIVRNKRFDAVLGSWVHPDGYVAQRLAKFLKVPYFVKVHGSDINVLTADKARKKQIKNVCIEASHVFTPSDALRLKVCDLGVGGDKVSRVYNGVDNNLFYVDQISGSPYFLFVGNLKKDKGVLDLLDAYYSYVSGGGCTQLILIGGGAMKKVLHERIEQYGLKGRVTLLGAMKHADVAGYVRRCKVLVLPSYHEGVPNVLLESAASGIPVIATRVGGIPEVVKDGITGILITPGDCIALSSAMIRVDERYSEWNKNEIQEHGKQFSWSTNVAELDRVIKNQLGGSGNGQSL